MKKILSIIVALAMILSLPFIVNAEQEDQYATVNGIKYLFCETYWAVIGPEDNSISGAVEIPAAVKRGAKDYPVEEIYYDAFYYCKNITSVTLPSTIRTIESYAFEECIALESINIPNSVETIGYAAFGSCARLKSIELPAEVELNDAVFSGCGALEKITVAEGGTKYKTEGNCLIDIEAKKVIRGCFNSVIPTDGSVTVIGREAFAGIKKLKNIKIPSVVTSIRSEAFCNTGLANVTVPAGVTQIAYGTFAYCRDLESITITDSVKEIDPIAFCECESLKTVKYTGSEEKWKEVYISNWGNDPIKNAEVVFNAKITEPGDVNGDNSVDNKDVVILFRYVSTPNAAYDPAYDFNGDNAVDNKDVVALFRHVST